MLYLHHVELGQRYPISEDVIIGRQSGHILFPKDSRLSNQHCRIFQSPEGGLSIRDLGSESGTVVDGRLLSPEKSYNIRDGTLIAVGAQMFKCVEPQNHPVRRKKKKRLKSGTDLSLLFGLVLVIAAGAFVAQYQKPILPKLKHYAALALNAFNFQTPPAPMESPQPPAITSPFEIVYKDVEGAYQQYRQIGAEVQAGSMNKKAMAAEFRNSLIPKFQAVHAKLAVLKPSKESERRRIEVNSKLVAVIIKQITAMASYAETSNPKYSVIIENIIPEVEAASDEARKVNDRRVPAGESN